jgi:hypothetical protein
MKPPNAQSYKTKHASLRFGEVDAPPKPPLDQKWRLQKIKEKYRYFWERAPHMLIVTAWHDTEIDAYAEAMKPENCDAP